MSWQSALRDHWPEYLIEGWALGCFMLAVGVFAAFLGSPESPIYRFDSERRAACGAAWDLRWGRRRCC